MSSKRRCIFHLPYAPDPIGRPSGTNVRPLKMLRGFREAGFDVLEVVGTSNERRQAIRSVRALVEAGERFDFVYSESETMPTLLTDPDHFPRHPFMDFNFFRFCRRMKIPVGLFLRDAHWMSEEYGRLRAGAKGMVSSALHWYDLRQYESAIDALFVPTTEFASLLGERLKTKPKIPLPSAVQQPLYESALARASSKTATTMKGSPLRLAYVGGISVGEAYDLSALLQAVAEVDGVNLSLCVRKADWERVKEHYEALIGPSVDVLHVQGRQLKELLVSNDVGMLFYPNSQYRALAMPAKVFEYLEAGLPIIATKDTAAGGFVAANGCGWALSFSRDELVHLLSSLRDDRERLITKGLHCLDVARNNTWVHRAEKVAEVLGAI